MLTLERLLAHVTDELERPPSAANSIEYLVNEAGVAWCNVASWSYLRRQRLELPLVIGQAVYPLGPALLEIQSIADPSYPGWWPGLMPRADFDTWKSATGSPTVSFYQGTLYSDSIDGVRQKVLELWPAPAAVRTLSIIHARGWAPVDKLTDAIDLPVQLEPAFAEWVRKFAAGREKRMPFERALELAKASSIVQDALAREGRDNPSLPPDIGRVGEQYAMRAGNIRGWDPRYRGSSEGQRY